MATTCSSNYLRLAQHFLYGYEQDFVKGKGYLCKAAALGNTDAWYTIGECYHIGMGVERDYQNAMRWYRKAVSNGAAPTQFVYQLVRSSAKQGNQEAIALLLDFGSVLWNEQVI